MPAIYCLTCHTVYFTLAGEKSGNKGLLAITFFAYENLARSEYSGPFGLIEAQHGRKGIAGRKERPYAK